MKKLIITILLALGIWSCGSLKKHKEETKEEKESFSNSNTEVNYQLDKFSLEPVDLQRPILVGGKEYHNTKIVVEKEVGKIDQVENTGEKSKNENLRQDKEKDANKKHCGNSPTHHWVRNAVTVLKDNSTC